MPTSNGKKDSSKRRRPEADPPPPPPPPQALIQLLRSDASVLEYFTSLQASLSADVKKWKERAEHYQKECKELQRTKKRKPTHFLSEQTARRRKETNQPQNDTGEVKIPEASVNDTKAAPSVEINDSIFAFSSDDENENGEVKIPEPRVNGTKAAPSVEINDSLFAFSSDDDSDAKDAHAGLSAAQEETNCKTFELLTLAYNNLNRIGVVLVVEEKDELNCSDGNAIDGFLTNGPAPKLLRRSDHDVAADIIHALHTLTRIQLQVKDPKAYPPFSTDRFIPCCDMELHPTAQGKECVLQALSVMDVYCTLMPDHEWDKLFSSESKHEHTCEAIRVGMRDRRLLVEELLSSLSGEVSCAWAVADRSLRLITTALHYEVSLDDQVIPFTGEFGTKSQARLSTFAERRLLTQVVSRLWHNRDDDQEAISLVCKYILSAAPAFGVEEYPRLPPALSLCVLESLLCPDDEPAASKHSLNISWIQLLQQQITPEADDNPTLLLRGIALAIHATAQIWKIRLASPDDRISDISRVEVAAYDRLLESQRSWLLDLSDEPSLDACRDEASLLLQDALKNVGASGEAKTSRAKCEFSFAVQVALIVIGDMKTLMETFEKATRHSAWISLACCTAFKQLQVRKIDTFRLKQGSLVSRMSPSTFFSIPDQMTSRFDILLQNNGPISDLVDSILDCCVQLSDAEYLYKLLLWFANQNIQLSVCKNLCKIISRHIGAPFLALRSPTVRVINLKRRPDRIRSFMAQAQSEGILVSKAVARLDKGLDPVSERIASSSDTEYIWGLHAFDGQGRLVEAESRLSSEIGGELSAFIESHWRPNDLKAFDKDARNDDSLVRMSPSEEACALSHIASWKGVYHSLATCPPQEDLFGTFRLPLTISGYARGKALLHTNEHMAPCPICVILEDDSILVDRFVDRLSLLLEELPRDFHFCSLGYSRPKTAPMAKYSSQLGIPSCIWYLTGYILSLEGAKHLLDSLPVRGPVDSWIGLKMCANWDNVFGQAMGVGLRASGASAELPSRKDLARIIKFRAFAALVPLCSQKVDTRINTTVGRSWRQRDTDVTYSGNLVPVIK
jgi:GR25 family glycosyltransferase involved in LPS biosynthesis